MEVYSQMVTEELMYQLPFKQILEFARINRAPNFKVMYKEIQTIVDGNNEEILSFMLDSVLKATVEEVTLGSVTDSTLDEIKDKIDYINSKFGHVDAYFNSLNLNDQKRLLLSFIEKEIKFLINNKDNFRALVAAKVKWDSNDALIYSYYLLYLDAMSVWRRELKRASRYTIGGRLNTIKALLLVYKPLLLAYISNREFPNKVLVKKIAELRASVNPTGLYPTQTKMYEISRVVSDISPI